MREMKTFLDMICDVLNFDEGDNYNDILGEKQFKSWAFNFRRDFTAAVDQSGCTLFTKAAIPLRCGVDIEVPDITLKNTLLLLDSSGEGENGHAANTFTPGPMISGFKIPGLVRLGPLEEKEVTSGALAPNTVPSKSMDAIGVVVELI